MRKIERDIRTIYEQTDAEARRLPPAQARDLRAQALEHVRELTARDAGTTLRLVDWTLPPPPGVTGRRRAGL